MCLELNFDWQCSRITFNFETVPNGFDLQCSRITFNFETVPNGFEFGCVEAKDLFHALVKIFADYVEFEDVSLNNPKEFKKYVAHIREEYADEYEKVDEDWLISYLEDAEDFYLLTIYVGTPLFETSGS